MNQKVTAPDLKCKEAEKAKYSQLEDEAKRKEAGKTSQKDLAGEAQMTAVEEARPIRRRSTELISIGNGREEEQLLRRKCAWRENSFAS